MQNIKVGLKGTILTLEVDLSKSGTASASGKSEVVASTHGNVPVPGPDGAYDLRLGLNLFRPVTK